MAAKKAINILRDFFKEQENVCDLSAVRDDEKIIHEIINIPNPGVAKAKQNGVSITIAEGDTIYRVGADDNKVEIRTVSSRDVQLDGSRFSIR